MRLFNKGGSGGYEDDYDFISLFEQCTPDGCLLKIAIDKTRAVQIPEGGSLDYYLSLSTDEYEKLRPKAEENSLKYIVFDSHRSYRAMDEGDDLAYSKLTESLSTIHLKKNLEEVSSSDYLAWFHKQSCGIHEDRNLRHFLISTESACIDVLAFSPPKIFCADGTELIY
jgi:hypothetical protein